MVDGMPAYTRHFFERGKVGPLVEPVAFRLGTEKADIDRLIIEEKLAYEKEAQLLPAHENGRGHVPQMVFTFV